MVFGSWEVGQKISLISLSLNLLGRVSSESIHSSYSPEGAKFLSSADIWTWNYVISHVVPIFEGMKESWGATKLWQAPWGPKEANGDCDGLVEGEAMGMIVWWEEIEFWNHVSRTKHLKRANEQLLPGTVETTHFGDVNTMVLPTRTAASVGLRQPEPMGHITYVVVRPLEPI